MPMTDAERAEEYINAEIAKLRAALEPFAAYVRHGAIILPDEFVITQGSGMARKQLTVGDCRRALEALG